MPEIEILKLSTVDASHPRLSLLSAYGPATIVRLSLDPTELPKDARSRDLKLNWLPRMGERIPQTLFRRVSWEDVPRHVLDDAQRWSATTNKQDITEQAAIGLMALLIHNLEEAVIVSVLQIGSGGDYLLRARCQSKVVTAFVAR